MERNVGVGVPIVVDALGTIPRRLGRNPTWNGLDSLFRMLLSNLCQLFLGDAIVMSVFSNIAKILPPPTPPPRPEEGVVEVLRAIISELNHELFMFTENLNFLSL